MSEKITNIDTPEIIVTITGGNEVITISGGSSIEIISVSSEGKQGGTGQGVPVGGANRQVLSKIDGTDYNTEWAYDWSTLALNIKYNGTSTDIASGRVLEGSFIGIGLIYRFISTAKTGKYPTEDSFYTNFDGSNLTNLIVTRG